MSTEQQLVKALHRLLAAIREEIGIDTDNPEIEVDHAAVEALAAIALVEGGGK